VVISTCLVIIVIVFVHVRMKLCEIDGVKHDGRPKIEREHRQQTFACAEGRGSQTGMARLRNKGGGRAKLIQGYIYSSEFSDAQVSPKLHFN